MPSGPIPWYRALGAIAGLRSLGVSSLEGVEDEQLRAALIDTLRQLAPERRVATSLEWILGFRPDQDALRFHQNEMEQQADATAWLVDTLLYEEVAHPPAMPPPAAMSALLQRSGTVLASTVRPDESLPGESEIAYTTLRDAMPFDHASFVAFAYRRILGRSADTQGRDYYANRLAARETNRPHVLRELLWSEELRTAGVQCEALTETESARLMATAWDERARDDAPFYIASGASGQEDEFRCSGARELLDVVLDGLEVRPSASVLEIGCGIGRILVPLSERVRLAYGVDISPAMIEQSRVYCGDRRNVRTSVTDGTLAAFADESIDLVISYLVFQHIPDGRAIARYVREAARVLTPGGVLRFQVDGRWRPDFVPDTYDGIKFRGEDVRSLVAAAGLSICGEWGEDTHYYWIDARKGNLEGASVRVLPRVVDTEFLCRLLEFAGVRGAVAIAERVGRTEQSVRSALAQPLSRLPSDPADFLRELFLFLLGREPRPDEYVFHGGALARGSADRDSIIDSIITSGQFQALARCVPAEIQRRQRANVTAALKGTLREIGIDA